MAIGGAITQGDSLLFNNPLGVVELYFKGWYLGRTNAATTMSFDEDVKDIICQQNGTKAADHVRTGIDVLVSASLCSPSGNLLEILNKGVQSAADGNSGIIGRNIYTSLRDTEAGVLKIVSVDANGVASTDIKDQVNMYAAIPINAGDILNWDADAQRTVPMEFRCKFEIFETPVTPTIPGAFGYWGDPVVEQVPAVVWPDVAAPVIVSAIASDATTLAVTFDENIAFQTAFDGGHYTSNVEGSFVAPTAGVIATDTLTLTFPAATFSAGDEITLSISGAALKDTLDNLYGGVSNQEVTNNVV